MNRFGFHIVFLATSFTNNAMIEYTHVSRIFTYDYDVEKTPCFKGSYPNKCRSVSSQNGILKSGYSHLDVNQQPNTTSYDI